ncbi:hypothetical protein Mapa_016054 [Marchantia paleacea]|nr:hypothetical protein Mapa_016054 [Marchantia paleacea]
MDLNMEELLLSGVHGVYKFSAIRLQLKYGEVEIGPTQKKKKKKGMSNEVDGRGDAADVVLQVYNAFAHEVEIEYQPAVKQEDTQWRFACDGRVLKTVVPYKFWKTYLYPHEQEDSPLEPEEDADPVPSNPSSSSSSAGAFTREIAEYGIAQGNEDLLAPSNGASDVYSWIGRGFMQQHDRRPVCSCSIFGVTVRITFLM